MLLVEWEENGFQYGGISAHFVDASKMVLLGSGSQRKIEDLLLTRYAGHLLARNGAPDKEKITTSGVLL